MKTKIIVVVLFFSFTVFAQNVKVPQKTKDGFAKLYPNVIKVKWGKEGKKDFEAEFTQNGQTISVVMNKNGELLETEADIDISDLPKGSSTNISEKHPGYKITEAAKIVDSKGVVTFEAEITKGDKREDLIFNADGKPFVKDKKQEENDEKNEKAEKDEKNEDND